MENEYLILNSIEKNENATQRDIARSTGMSLGSVNVLIKRLMKKGLLKIERLNPRTIRYILTPQGLKEKAERTYRYILSSYNQINRINTSIDNLLQRRAHEEIKQVILFGIKDEIYELLIDRLNRYKLNHIHVHKTDELQAAVKKLSTGTAARNREPTTENRQLIITWHPDYTELLESKNIQHLSLLDML